MAAALRRLGACTGYSLGHEAALLRGARHDPPEVAAAGGACLDESVLSDFLHDLQLARWVYRKARWKRTFSCLDLRTARTYSACICSALN